MDMDCEGYCEMCVECTADTSISVPPYRRYTKAEIDAMGSCPICHSPALVHAAGCAHCMACGWSVCE